MIQLTRAVKAWGKPDFNTVLKHDIEQINIDELPLEQGLCSGNYVAGKEFSAMIISAAEADKFIRAKAGIFYKGILGGCACADDPTPVEEQSEYCELLFDIDKETAETAVTLAPQ